MEQMKYPKPRKNKIGEHYGHWIVKEQEIEESIKQSKFPVIVPPEDCQAASKKGIEAVKNRRQ